MAVKSHFVPLRHLIEQLQATGQNRARRQASVIGDDGHIVAFVHPDGQRGH